MDESTSLLQNPVQPQHQWLTRPEKAAWIIDETTRGTIILSVDAVPPTRANRAAYLFFENTSWLRKAAAFFLIVLSFVELPSWCSSTHVCRSPDGSSAFLSGLPYLSPIASITINLTLLSILIFFALFDYIAIPISLHIDIYPLYTILVALIIDAVYVIFCNGYPPIRFAPFIRTLLPLFYWNALRECTFSIIAVVSPFFDVVFFVILFIILFGWVVTLFFHDVPEADRYFGGLLNGTYSAFTSLTTADWPMQIMGVLDVSRASSLLFIAFIVIGVFLMFNLLLAVVYNAYTSYIEELVIEKLTHRRQSVGIAFDVLAGDGDVTLPDVTLMFQELRKNKRHAHFSDEVIDFVFTALDDDFNNRLSRNEFMDIVDILQLKFIFEMEDKSPIERWMPIFYDTPAWQSISSYVKSDSFSYVVDAFLMFNVLIVVLETTMDLQDKDTPTSVLLFSIIECAFSGVYLLEMALKMATIGFQSYWRDLGSRFDFWVTWLLLLATLYVLLPFIENNTDVIRFFILLRCLRLFRLLADIPRFRRLVRVFSVLIPASLPLFSFFFLSLYAFAALGTEIFGGLIYQNNPDLNVETHPLVAGYVSNDYWVLNFNDLAAGWFTLFSSVIVGYMTEIAEAIAATSWLGDWSKWFFVASFTMNTLIVSNCVVAFVVDLFVMEDGTENVALLQDLQSRYGTKRVRVIQYKNTADQVYATMFKERVEQLMASHV